MPGFRAGHPGPCRASGAGEDVRQTPGHRAGADVRRARRGRCLGGRAVLLSLLAGQDRLQF